jgi:hypothetical protein
MIALILMCANRVADWLALRLCQRPAVPRKSPVGPRRKATGPYVANRAM